MDGAGRIKRAESVTGYLHRGYAASLAEFGVPRELRRSRGWILVRAVPNSVHHDAIGCYPLFACENWSELGADLQEVGKDLVSLALVADPFGQYDTSTLRGCFDTVTAFKEHFVVDLERPIGATSTKHHRYYARRSLQKVAVEEDSNPSRSLDVWTELYAHLVERHHISGLRAFSKRSFAQQLTVPGIMSFRAIHDGQVVGMHLWYAQNGVAYSHLEAVNRTGYETGASYALYWRALHAFSGKLRWADLGSAAGRSEHALDGLARFKKGWASGSRTAFFCGRIFDPHRYEELANANGVGATDYFPAYRKGEFI
jgi:hypothetical protein